MDGRPVTCCFTGHRPASLPWGTDETDPRCIALRERISGAAESAIELGARHFICGMAEGCDMYFCEEIIRLRRRYPHITLEAAIPCLTQSDGWSAAQRLRYRSLLAQCDMETLVQEDYTPGCMHRRNRYMVDHAALLIAVHNGLPGGTRSTVEYAMRRGVSIVDIPLET